jgi:predicted transposase/invertase (TIGR01784 family)
LSKALPNYTEDIMTFAQQLKQEGLQQGRQEILVLVRNLLKQNVPLATIKSASGLSEQELLELEDA